MVLKLAALLALPAIGLAVLWLLMDRWGRVHDPMQRTRFDHLTPGWGARRNDTKD